MQKKMEKYFWSFLYLYKKYGVRIKKEKCKMTIISHNGPGGVNWKRGAKSRTDSGPAQASHLQPSALFEQAKTRVS